MYKLIANIYVHAKELIKCCYPFLLSYIIKVILNDVMKLVENCEQY